MARIEALHSDGVRRYVEYDESQVPLARAQQTLHDLSPEGKAEFETKITQMKARMAKVREMRKDAKHG